MSRSIVFVLLLDTSFELQMPLPIHKPTHTTIDIVQQKYKNNIPLFDYIRLVW
jgi:hypothetical protein